VNLVEKKKSGTAAYLDSGDMETGQVTMNRKAELRHLCGYVAGSVMACNLYKLGCDSMDFCFTSIYTSTQVRWSLEPIHLLISLIVIPLTSNAQTGIVGFIGIHIH
jgi:hypothetical protein